MALCPPGKTNPPNFHLISNGLAESLGYGIGTQNKLTNYLYIQGQKTGIPRYVRLKSYEVMNAQNVEYLKKETEKQLNHVCSLNFGSTTDDYEEYQQMMLNKQKIVKQNAKKNSKF